MCFVFWKLFGDVILNHFGKNTSLLLSFSNVFSFLIEGYLVNHNFLYPFKVKVHLQTSDVFSFQAPPKPPTQSEAGRGGPWLPPQWVTQRTSSQNSCCCSGAVVAGCSGSLVTSPVVKVGGAAADSRLCDSELISVPSEEAAVPTLTNYTHYLLCWTASEKTLHLFYC